MYGMDAHSDRHRYAQGPGLSPILDLVRILSLANDVHRLGTGALVPRGVMPDGQTSPSLPTLWELGKALFLSPLTSTPDFAPLVERLRSIHNASRNNGRGDGAHCEKTHRTFSELETKLREQSEAVDRLLGSRNSREVRGKAVLHALQQTLFLQCPQGGKTAGRFRCVNKTGKSAVVDIRARRCSGPDGILQDEATIDFEPNGRRLEPEETGLFRAVIDMSNCRNPVAQPLEIGADVYVGGELTLKLFVNVEVYVESAASSEN